MRTARRLFAAICGLLALAPSLASAFAGQQRTVMMQPPGWVQYGQNVAMDFANRRYWVAGQGYQSPLALTSTSRASIKYCQRLDGIWIQAPSNYPCITGNGILIEEARTNDALQSRDMTQATWVKASGGITAALNATGIDGSANSATTLTAAGVASSCAANACSALQSITLGSTADTYSVWLERVSGSGAVSITINNLTGTTACTLVTTAFTRCSVTATLANPVIGIAMATVGDVIIADGNQMEPGGFATSPIFTMTTSAARAADSVLSTGALNLLESGVSGSLLSVTNSSPTMNGVFLDKDDSNNIFAQISSTSSMRMYASGNSVTASLGSGLFSGIAKTNVSWGVAGASVVGNYGAVVVNATSIGGSLTFPRIGNYQLGFFMDAYFVRLGGYSYKLPDAFLKELSK